MEQATDHDSMIRAQAKCQLLKSLFGPQLEGQALARYQHTNSATQAYMARDAFDEETAQ